MILNFPLRWAFILIFCLTIFDFCKCSDDDLEAYDKQWYAPHIEISLCGVNVLYRIKKHVGSVRFAEFDDTSSVYVATKQGVLARLSTRTGRISKHFKSQKFNK